MSTTLTTQEIADHTGLSVTSVVTTLRRKGIEPVHREPGAGGQNVYPAAAVYAHWPRPSGMAFTNMLTFEHVTTLTRRWDIVDGEPTAGEPGRASLIPTQIVLSYHNFHDGRGWIVSGVIHGSRILQDGSRGSEVRYLLQSEMSDNPAWVAKLATDNTPPPVDRPA